MSNFIALILIGLLLFGAAKFSRYWESVKARQEQAETGQQGGTGVLPGMPETMEASLQAARKQGAAGLRTWLKQYRSFVKDPRVAQIELDFVVLVATSDRNEAQRVFESVRARLLPGSPMYDRMKKLEKTYQ